MSLLLDIGFRELYLWWEKMEPEEKLWPMNGATHLWASWTTADFPSKVKVCTFAKKKSRLFNPAYNPEDSFKGYNRYASEREIRHTINSNSRKKNKRGWFFFLYTEKQMLQLFSHLWILYFIQTHKCVCVCVCVCDIKVEMGAGEMAQQLRALAVLPEVLSSIPSNHMVAHNHL